jgi:hypothetical protein
MTQRFSSLTFTVLLLIPASAYAQTTQYSVLSTQYAQADTSRTPGASTPATTHHSPPTSAVTPLPAPPAGNDLLTQASTRLAAEPAISADLRYRIDAYGHELIGTGSYLQLASGASRLLKLELKMQVEGKPALLQEIRGEDFYWIRRDIPPNPPWLGRVNLRQLKSSLDPTLDNSSDVLPQGGWIVLGGLPRLLSSLANNFEFDAPRAEELEHYAADGQTIESSPIWVLAGRWKPDRLKALTGNGSAKPSDLPEQLPDKVEVILGRTEKLVLLFPYRVTYWRTPKADRAAARPGASESRKLLTLDLFNVTRQDIDPGQFRFDAGDHQDILDLTASYIHRATTETKLR